LASKSVEVIDTIDIVVAAALAELEWVEMVFRDQKQNRRSAREAGYLNSSVSCAASHRCSCARGAGTI